MPQPSLDPLDGAREWSAVEEADYPPEAIAAIAQKDKAMRDAMRAYLKLCESYKPTFIGAAR